MEIKQILIHGVAITALLVSSYFLTKTILNAYAKVTAVNKISAEVHAELDKDDPNFEYLFSLISQDREQTKKLLIGLAESHESIRESIMKTGNEELISALKDRESK